MLLVNRNVSSWFIRNTAKTIERFSSDTTYIRICSNLTDVRASLITLKKIDPDTYKTPIIVLVPTYSIDYDEVEALLIDNPAPVLIGNIRNIPQDTPHRVITEICNYDMSLVYTEKKARIFSNMDKSTDSIRKVYSMLKEVSP